MTRPPDPLARLLAGYRPRTDEEAADLERVRALLSAGDPWRRSSPLHVTGSALIVHPPSRRVLLRWHARQQAWIQVGGHADPGEGDPLAVALREGREETGLDDLVPWPDAALVHVVVVPVPAAAHEPAHEHADLRFVLATNTPEAARPEEPAAALRWLTFADARAATAEANLHETLARAERLLDGGR
jgi:8-oxo-dGTP pyrophosphatase MutT (NUDIX family)